MASIVNEPGNQILGEDTHFLPEAGVVSIQKQRYPLYGAAIC